MELQLLSIAIAGLALAAAATYNAFQLRAQNRMRQASLLMSLYARLDSLEYQEAWHKWFWMEYADYDDAIRQMGGRHPGSFVAYLYDEVGVLLRHRLIDEALAYDLFGNSLFQMWEKVAPIIREARRRSDDPTIYENWEYVYLQLKRRRERKGGHTARRDMESPGDPETPPPSAT